MKTGTPFVILPACVAKRILFLISIVPGIWLHTYSKLSSNLRPASVKPIAHLTFVRSPFILYRLLGRHGSVYSPSRARHILMAPSSNSSAVNPCLSECYLCKRISKEAKPALTYTLKVGCVISSKLVCTEILRNQNNTSTTVKVFIEKMHT